MLDAYLAAIPEPRRGIFLIRPYNGLRPSEARALNVQDYDLKRNVVTLRHSKTGDLLTFPADWEVAEWVHKHVDPRAALRGDVPLFVNPETGGRWTAASERRLHLLACKQIGAYFKPNHCGRHAFGTHALRRTKELGGSHDLAAVQKAMRHSDPRTTQGYIDRDVIDVVGVLWRRPRRR